MQAALSAYCSSDETFRGVHLIATAFHAHGLDVTMAEDAYQIIRSHNVKNLNAIKAGFDQKFGKNPPQGYYRVLRPLIRVIKGK